MGGRASPLGLGADIGGSVRIPAGYCGVYGIRGTPARFTLNGLESPHGRGIVGNEAVIAVVGPLGKSVEDLKLVLEAWLDDPEIREADPFNPGVAW